MGRVTVPASTYVSPLSEKLRKLGENVGRGMSWAAAARHVGLVAGGRDYNAWQADPRIAAVIAKERTANAKSVEMTRQKVMDGLLEAVQMAKLVSDPHALIKAWREIGLMCGFYAPEVKKLEISITARRAISQLEQLSDDELLKLAEKDLAEDAIDVDFHEVAEESTSEEGSEADPTTED